MSAATAIRRSVRPLRRDEASESTQPQLYVVRGVAPARSTLPFLVLVVLILSGALAASMMLNARMADTAYRMKDAQVQLNVINDHIETVRSAVQEASSPDRLAAQASELGMVPAGAPGVVDLDTGQVSGGAPASTGQTP